MGIVIWFVIGGVLGWMASIVVDDPRQSMAVNVLVGVAGALIGGMLLSPLLGIGDIDNYGLSFPAVLLSLCGALLLLFMTSRIRRARLKTRR